MGSIPRVSVVVCNLNGMRFLPRLLATLREQREVDTEIVVVDRESTDGSREYLARHPGIKVVTEPAASGLVAGYHAAVAAASHDLLFFCNEDLWLDADCLASLARHVSLADRIGAAVLVHRRMYLDVGGWDTSFFMDFDDVELFLRAWQRGWRCVAVPGARVYHAGGMSTFQAGPPPSEVRFRRHVGGESNRAVICLKHFTGPSLLWAAVLLLAPLAS